MYILGKDSVYLTYEKKEYQRNHLEHILRMPDNGILQKLFDHLYKGRKGRHMPPNK